VTEIVFTDPAIDDLRRLGPDVAVRVLKKALILLKDPRAGYPLGADLAGFRKLIVGKNTWRVVYRVAGERVEICEIRAVGPRADAQVYGEAVARVHAAGTGRPELLLLRDVVERLGDLARNLGLEPDRSSVPDPPPPREPVPDWLAERLIQTVGLAREEVAAFDLEQAVDRWAEYRSNSR
jgi:mRNA interferase RelE/StbE